MDTNAVVASNRWASTVLSVLRVVAAFLFIAHGTQKLFGFPAGLPQGPVPVASLAGAAGILETGGGLLLLVGLLSRPVAFVLCGEMAVAYFTQHAPQGFWPLLNGGELAALYCFIFLFVVAAGPGAWSLDAVIRSWRVRHGYTRDDRWVTSH